MKQYLSKDMIISVENHAYMSNFFPFYPKFKIYKKYIESGTNEDIKNFDQALDRFLKKGIKNETI